MAPEHVIQKDGHMFAHLRPSIWYSGVEKTSRPWWSLKGTWLWI